VLFRLVTGRYAFEAENNVKATVAVLADEPLKLCSVVSSAPPGLEEVVSKCLEKDVARRFQTAEELSAALLPFASERTRQAIEARGRDSVTEGAAPLASDVAPASSDGRRRPLVRAGLVLAALVVAGGLAVLKHATSSPAPRASAAASPQVTLDAAAPSP
jgi:serine/threonine-protein kinase